jgi:hypothetical protein
LQPEPVSPELVLVDPELARRERAKLEERAVLGAIHQAEDLRRAVERTLEPAGVVKARPVPRRELAAASGRRILAAALLCSLLANGFFAAKLLTRSEETVTSAAASVPTPLLTSQAQPATTPMAVPPETVRSNLQASPRVGASKGAIERKLVSLILTAPAGKLPHSFLDPTTGLIKNNVHVVCRRSTKRAFLCGIRPPSASARKALVVRYLIGRGGTGVFKWLGYKKSSVGSSKF